MSLAETAPATREAMYDPRIFDVGGEAAARAIILTPDSGQSTEERWRRETPYLASLATELLQLRPGLIALDFGCGIGRLARALIGSTQCSVIGVDSSASMRRLASGYVREENFGVLSPAMLAFLDMHFDAALAVWTLQHCWPLAPEVERLASILKPGGSLFVVNELYRCIPTNRGWIDDGEDVRVALAAAFGEPWYDAPVSPEVFGDDHSRRAYVACYRKA